MFLIIAPNGNSWYYYDEALKEVKTGADLDAGITSPMEEEYEGLTFQRFPVTEGNWYTEVHILRKGDSAPIIGWGVVEQSDSGVKLTRVALVDGMEARKLDK